MVVVALLRQAHLGFEAQHLLAVLAQRAVHQVLAHQHLADAVEEGVDHQRMVIEIGRLENLDIRMRRLRLIRRVVDALDQHAGEQEIREDNDPLVAKPGRVLERRRDQREGDARIGDLAPAEAHAFPQHAHDLGDIGIGIRIGRAASDHHEQRLVVGAHGGGGSQPLGDPVAGGPQHLQIDAQFAPIGDLEAVVCRCVGVENRGDVVLGVPGRKQHARHRQHVLHPLHAQSVEPVMDHRIGEFEVAVFDRHAGQPVAQCAGQARELVDGSGVAAAMAAQHHARLRW